MNDDFADIRDRQTRAWMSNDPEWASVGGIGYSRPPPPAAPKPNQHDRVIALSVLRGHVISTNPNVEAWVSLYRRCAHLCTPEELDAKTGAWDYERTGWYVFAIVANEEDRIAQLEYLEKMDNDRL